ncbi:MAG TPA: addiction module protein [Planctomycetota bacterium]|nr:addiction module protein [Planctomycetota bacterium]
MTAVEEVEQRALALNDEQRAKLVARLLDSLPGVLTDDDEGAAEGKRRAAELDADPSAGISLDELLRK